MAKNVFLFPGQGAQSVGMGRDFAETFSTARETFEEANDLLGRDLMSLIFEGPEQTLTATHNSQVALFVTSIAILRVIQEQYPDLQPAITAGLSLGEYTALAAAGKSSFADTLAVVQKRGTLMSEACEQTQGTMAVVLGLTGKEVEEVVRSVNLPNDLWAANFNCPGQVVISGTIRGIEAGTVAAKSRGAKRVLPLQVHGAFHSGLMESAQEGLIEAIEELPLATTSTELVMNVPGDFVSEITQIKQFLIRQVTHPVRWEEGIQAIQKQGVDLFLEIGSGKTLAGFNKRIGTTAPTLSIENVHDLDQLQVYA